VNFSAIENHPIRRVMGQFFQFAQPHIAGVYRLDDGIYFL
jgi:hypothetical protein